MERFDLPPELLGIEKELSLRPRPVPDGGLRSRVLAELKSEINRERIAAWEFIVSAAAILLLGINLAMSTALDPTWRLSWTPNQRSFEESSLHQERAFELPGEAVNRQAFLSNGSSW